MRRHRHSGWPGESAVQCGEARGVVDTGVAMVERRLRLNQGGS